MVQGVALVVGRVCRVELGVRCWPGQDAPLAVSRVVEGPQNGSIALVVEGLPKGSVAQVVEGLPSGSVAQVVEGLPNGSVTQVV